MDTDKLLEVRDLGIDYLSFDKRVSLVKDFNLCLHRGESLGIVGESGSGKTLSTMSLLKLISPKLIYSSGRADFYNAGGDSVDLLSLQEREIEWYRGKEFGVIFQEPMTSLNPAFKCGSQIVERLTRYMGYNKRESKDYTLDVFEDVKLLDPNKIFNSYPHEISGDAV